MPGLLSAPTPSAGRVMAEEGWRQALSRSFSPETVDRNVPLAEAIFWLSVIEDDQERVEGAAAYRTRRDARPEGQTAAALVFARNLVSHRLLIPTTKVRHGGPIGAFAVGTAPVAGAIVRWHWKSRLDLGNPTDNASRDAFYDTHVAGRPLELPLDAAARFFEI